MCGLDVSSTLSVSVIGSLKLSFGSLVRFLLVVHSVLNLFVCVEQSDLFVIYTCYRLEIVFITLV